MIKKISFILCLIFSIFLLYSCTTTSNKDIVDIKVINIPYQIEIGKFDEAGIEFEITYEDNEIEIEKVTEDKIPEEYKHYLYEEGNHSFSFLYKGIEVTFNIEMYKVGHSVTFINKNDEVVKKVILKENESLIFPTKEEMYVEGYKFLSFDHDGTNITSDITIRGIYVKVWTVSFYNGKNELIKIDLVEEGKSATEPTTQERVMEGYKFISWDTDFTNITSDKEVYGIYQKINQDDNEASQGLEYELNEDGKSYAVVGIGTCEDKDVIIPSSYQGYPVTSIRDEAFDDYGIITSITIPKTVINIEPFAFSYCLSLTNFIVDVNNNRYTSVAGNLYTKDGNSLIAYARGKNDTSFIIPSHVTSIETAAFYYCKNLTNIIISGSVKHIGSYAFIFCEGLTSIIIPANVVNIENYAFLRCDNLENIIVSEKNNYYKSMDGNLYSKDGAKLIQYAIGKKDSSFIIPDCVMSIGEEAFSHCTSITNITIPESVTSIEEYAFAYCRSITNITIPDSVTSIGDSAFRECESLTNITITESVTSIGDYAFAYCSSLTNITIPESVTSIGYSAFNGCSSLTNITIPDSVTSIGDYAFAYCSSLTNITIPESVTSIGDSAFEDCRSLTNITIPESVTSIGSEVFSACDSLTSIIVYENNNYYKSIDGNLYTKDGGVLIQYAIGKKDSTFVIPNSVISIGYRAFDSCDSLTSIIIPNSVISIGYRAFDSCDSLTSIIIPNSVTSIGDSAFEYCRSLTNITIPESVTSIGDSAFEYCRSLTNITIPDSVTSIGDYAFAYCYSLTNITIPESVTSIGYRAFYYCTSLIDINVSVNNNNYQSINGNLYSKDGAKLIQYAIGKKDSSFIIPDCVMSIGGEAFYGCDSLTNITIPESVTSIGYGAFEYCRSLTNITIPESVTSIGDRAFEDCISLKNITIPESVTSIGDSAFHYCTSLIDINVSVNNNNYQSINGNLYSKDGAKLIQYAIGKKDSSFIIPDCVMSIGEEAFSHCTSITNITIPESVTSIGDSAFKYCSSLKNITIPESVTSIGDFAFNGCYSLTIYCEAESEPSGWYIMWNSSNCPVVWGYTE